MKLKELLRFYGGDLSRLELIIYDDLGGCSEFNDYADTLSEFALNETVISFYAINRNFLKIVV